MRKLLLMLLTAATAIAGQALTVTNTPGKLASIVDDDTQITTLIVTGTMDARDFRFIADSLRELTTLDLSQVTIKAYTNTVPLFGVSTDYTDEAIPRTALFGKKLTSVKLSPTLKEIGYGAFAGCDQLTSIEIPASVTTIGDYAFAGTGLTNVTLPATVTTMGKGVFARCTSLTSAVIAAAGVGDFAFLGDTLLTTVQLGTAVPSIGIGAFNGCKALTAPTIGIGSQVTSIGDEAFIASGLTSISLSALTLTGGIGDWAFAQTPITSIALPAGMNKMGEGVFAHDYQLQNVSFPVAGVINKRPGATDNLGPRRLKDWDASDRNTTVDGSTKVKLATPLSVVNAYTFASDTMLTLYELLPYGVATIGDFAFYNNSQATDTMTLPSTVTYLGERAMAGMTGMKTLRTDNASVPEVGNEVWAGVNQSIVPLITPDKESTALYKVADQWMYFFYENDILLGDVNGDGVVDLTDVSLLIDYMLGGDVTIIKDNADMDQNGEIDLTDLSKLIDYILGSSSNTSLHKMRALCRNRYASTTDALGVNDFAMAPGETRVVEVLLNNDERDYTSLQCEITLPQGITLKNITAADRDSEHQALMRAHVDDENIVSVICYDLNLNTFAGNEGAILRLTLVAAADYDQSGVLSIDNVRLCSDKKVVYLADNAVAQVNVSSTTGVETVNADRQVASVRYINLSGQESSEPFSGVNIVVTTYTDGTTSTAKELR